MNVNDMWKVPIPDAAQPETRAEAERAMRRARRDMFATAALTGLLADPNLNCAPELIAKGAVNNADALIAELDRTEPK